MSVEAIRDAFVALGDAAHAAEMDSPFAAMQEARNRAQDNENEFLRLTASKAIVELEINRDAANLRRLAIQIDAALHELGCSGIHSLPNIKDAAE